MAPLEFAAPERVTLTGDVPSLSRTTAFVEQPAGAVLACASTRVTVTPLSIVHVAPVQVVVSVPGRKTFCSERGADCISSPFTRNFAAATPLASTTGSPAALNDAELPPPENEEASTTWHAVRLPAPLPSA